jgi:putative multicomponent Na+:H+ antiporter subunit B
MADLADLSENIYVAAIMVLLPLTAAMVVTQKNPYHALVIRGILGAVAALVYALFGAADVALTEALVGTMLSITLYAIAVRSSMSMRLGVLVPEVVAEGEDAPPDPEPLPAPLLSALRSPLRQYHLGLQQVPYPTPQTLSQALYDREVHAIYGPPSPEVAPHQLQIRVKRLYEVISGAIAPEVARVAYVPVTPTNSTPAPDKADLPLPKSVEMPSS